MFKAILQKTSAKAEAYTASLQCLASCTIPWPPHWSRTAVFTLPRFSSYLHPFPFSKSTGKLPQTLELSYAHWLAWCKIFSSAEFSSGTFLSLFYLSKEDLDTIDQGLETLLKLFLRWSLGCKILCRLIFCSFAWLRPLYVSVALCRRWSRSEIVAFAWF